MPLVLMGTLGWVMMMLINSLWYFALAVAIESACGVWPFAISEAKMKRTNAVPVFFKFLIVLIFLKRLNEQ